MAASFQSTARIIGARELHAVLIDILQNIGDLTFVTKRLAKDMTKFAHVDTGYMKGTIYHTFDIAGADAPYAGFEADRGGSHDFAQRAINAFPVDEYFNEIVRPF